MRKTKFKIFQQITLEFVNKVFKEFIKRSHYLKLFILLLLTSFHLLLTTFLSFQLLLLSSSENKTDTAATRQAQPQADETEMIPKVKSRNKNFSVEKVEDFFKQTKAQRICSRMKCTTKKNDARLKTLIYIKEWRVSEVTMWVKTTDTLCFLIS